MRPTLPTAKSVIAGLALGAVCAVPASASGTTSLVGQPVAAIGRYHGTPFFETYARTNRPIPRKRSGTLLGAMRLDGLGVETTPDASTFSSFGFRSIATRGKRYCYAQSFAEAFEQYPITLQRARVGQRVQVEVLISAVATPLVARTTLRPRFDLTEEQAARKLGCLGPSPNRAMMLVG